LGQIAADDDYARIDPVEILQQPTCDPFVFHPIM
jgi:hypothetical protein